MQEEPIKKGREELQKPDELEECKKNCDEYLNNWKRAAADLINYKKEEMERTVKLMQYGKEDMIEKVLPIFDSIYLAEQHSHILENMRMSEWTKGFLQIKNQISDFLKKEGIEEIKAVGEKFDPNTMEVVLEVDLSAEALAKEGGEESGIVIEELQKGYKMDDKVLRPARVKVSK